jgi:flagellar motility protein MotE (MotC chaperone)
MKSFVRPLPLTIAGMAVLTCIKVGGLVQAVGFSTPARASTSHSAPAKEAPAAAEARPRPPEPPAAPPAAPAEPAVSEAERAVLQDLRARRAQLETRSQGLDAREALLAAAERRLNERVEQLATLQAKLEQLEAGRRERDEANWRGLVKTYETMRPRDAASIFNELDTPVLLQVLDRMKEAKAAPILAAMTPERARAVTAQLAEFRAKATAAPTVGEQGGKP